MFELRFAQELLFAAVFRPAPPGGFSALSVFHSEFTLYGRVVWARGALNSRIRLFPTRAVGLVLFFAIAFKDIAKQSLTNSIGGEVKDKQMMQELKGR